MLRDVKLKYRGSVFGFFWSLANPLMMVITYTIAFSYILQVRTEGFVFNLLLGILNWTFFSSSAMMSTGICRGSRSARQERRFSPGDSAGRNGLVQSRSVSPHDCGVPSGRPAHIRRCANAGRPVVSGASRTPDSLYLGCGVCSRDVDVVLPRCQPHSGDCARHPVLDHADSLPVRQLAGTAATADSAQPDVFVRRCVSADLSFGARAGVLPSGSPPAAMPWACSFWVRRCSSVPRIGWRSRSDVDRD